MNEFADIHIRWNNGQDLLLTVSLYNDNMGDIKQLIRKNAVEQTSKKTIRLIHRGQLLNNDLYTLSDYGIQQQHIFIHCALSDPIIPTNIIYDIETTDKNDSISGFDKLRESGYNEEEIRSIRLQFHQMQSTSNYVDGEPPSDQDLQLEEEWMEHTGRRLPEGYAQGSFKEMMCGLLLGCFLGVLCLFWVRESVFTRRHQMGILAGMLINVSCGINYVYY
ncbi:uncharacterized protein ATC70_012921 [Mucor velutinosus]|uniref:Ubiquitin-like domain-containing protein n=1 Tax=Mucor velutinosus TaxID=708070 RepID=A0AAN7HZ68_9FUNG|nr:hypothetical protein ATC70_012921 [Mucor velutinosus]